MKHVFLSYAATDDFAARRIAEGLQELGTTVWTFDQVSPGENFVEAIERSLRDASAVIVLVTPRSVASEWVTREWSAAIYSSKVVIPVLVDVSYEDLPPLLASRNGLVVDGDDYGSVVRAIHEALEDRPPVEAAHVLNEKELHRIVELTVVQVLARIGVNSEKEEKGTGVDRSQVVIDESMVFVITSFAEKMEPIYEAISAAAKTVGLNAVRVKDVVGDYRITEKMLDMIRGARFVVADLTDERPNVYFELGYARGIGKNIITIAREDTKVHFDVYDWTYMSYIDSRPLEKKLIDRFKLEMSR